jgi:cytochrome c553
VYSSFRNFSELFSLMQLHIRSLLLALFMALATLAVPRSAYAICGDFNADDVITATDALGVLRVAIGVAECELWTCDVDESGSVTATDSLRLLQFAVGQSVSLDCPVNPANCVSDIDYFFAQVWTPILTDCVGCHNPNGAAAATDHILLPASEPGYLEHNFEAERAFAAITEGKIGAELLLSKPLGTNHGGGQRLGMTTDSVLYQNLVGLLARFEDPTESCGGAPNDFYEGLGYLTPEQTLRKAAIVFAGRLPSWEEELAVVMGDEQALRETVRAMLSGDDFKAFLREGANDKFLTNKYLEDDNNPFAAIGGGGAYPHLKDRIREIEELLGPDNDAAATRRTKDAISREPLELVVNIVTKERPYTELLTADYFMVNPWSNVSFQSGLTFDDDWDDEEWREGRNLGYEYQPWPHAGILTSPIWLSRFPSTSTNRNRARARWAYDFFLGFDIEASAPRAVDPDALADEDNPTMNNVHCTVCHEKMDPVAGAFQNFGDSGMFRPEGTDALPDSYKESELYQEGDLWYRDMRSPGFNNTLMPASSSENSLAWLAEQMIADPRFARGTVEFWFPAVFGQEPLLAPAEPDDENYATRLIAWVAQDETIRELADRFATGSAGTGVHSAFNLKDLFVEMALSPVFTAIEVEHLDEDRADELAEMGLGRLLGPEHLNRKLNAATGSGWTQDSAGLKPELLGRYRTFYGGIDSVGVTERTRELNPLMSTVPQRMAYEMACPLAVTDFSLAISERILFPMVEVTDIPDGADGEAAIRDNIVFLHARLLGESLTSDAAEVDRTFALFSDVRQHRIDSAANPRLDRVYACEGVDFSTGEYFSQDDDHTVRAWMAVLVYLMGDYKFLYE